MVRVSAELIWSSPHFFNAVKERELDLRGNKIAVVENLGATEDQFDTIDLSDNEIVKLEGVPYLKRLRTLILNNNRVTRISPALGELLPNLHTLVLTNNRLLHLKDIHPLASLPSLQSLSLLDNALTKIPNYRLYVIHMLPSLRLLDFCKVRPKDRAQAAALFATSVQPPLLQPPPPEPLPDDDPLPPQPAPPTPAQITAIKAAIVNAQTLEEVARLEKALNSDQLPVDFKFQESAAPMDQE